VEGRRFVPTVFWTDLREAVIPRAGCTASDGIGTSGRDREGSVRGVEAYFEHPLEQDFAVAMTETVKRGMRRTAKRWLKIFSLSAVILGSF